MCKAIIQEEAVKPLKFIKDFLPSLLSLKDDPVPNVRITLAKTLTIYMNTSEFQPKTLLGSGSISRKNTFMSLNYLKY